MGQKKRRKPGSCHAGRGRVYRGRKQGGFIVGFDNDAPAVFQRQIDFTAGHN